MQKSDVFVVRKKVWKHTGRKGDDLDKSEVIVVDRMTNRMIPKLMETTSGEAYEQKKGKKLL